MRMTINEKDERLEVVLFFPDSRVVDLETALRLAGRPYRWRFLQTEKGLDRLEYKVTDGDNFLVTVAFTHGLEPPTRAIFENRPPEVRDYWPIAKHSLVLVVEAFLDESAARGLVSLVKKDASVRQLRQHDPELAGTR